MRDRYELITLDGETSPVAIGSATAAGVAAIITAIVGAVTAAAGVIIPAVQAKQNLVSSQTAQRLANEEAKKQAIMAAQIQADQEVAIVKAAIDARNKSAISQLSTLAVNASQNKTALYIGGSVLVAIIGYALTKPRAA